MPGNRNDKKERYGTRAKRRADFQPELPCSSFQQSKQNETSCAKRFRENSPGVKRLGRFNENRFAYDDCYTDSYTNNKIQYSVAGNRHNSYRDQIKNQEFNLSRQRSPLEYEENSDWENVTKRLNQHGLDKKTAFLLALKDSPTSIKTLAPKKSIPAESPPISKSQESPNMQRLFVGNLFNSVENGDLERLLETYGSIVEVRRYEKHAIVALNCTKEKAEQAIKDLDHNHWMDNWIRVKFDKFEMTKEESWKKKTRKIFLPEHSKYAHCDRATVESSESQGIMHSEYQKEWASSKMSSDIPKCKLIDIESKRSLTNLLKVIRHEHCIEMVDTLVTKQERSNLRMTKESGAMPVMAGIPVTSNKQDPRKPIDYKDIDF